jgi:hypothetical protein
MHSTENQNSTADPQLKDYILQNRQRGASDTQIREALLQAGWLASAVDQSFDTLRHSHPAATAHHTTSHHTVHQPSKYKLFTAIIDGFRALKANAKGFLLVLLVNMAISTAVFIAAVIVVMIAAVATGFATVGDAGLSVIAIIGLSVVGVLLLAAYIVQASFMVTSLTLTINDGAEGRQSDVGAVIRHTFKILPHVVLAQAVTTAILLAPIVLFGGLLIATSAASSGSMAAEGDVSSFATAFIIGMLMLIAYCIWIIVCSVVLVLVPMVATFEPRLSMRKTISRSWHLMKKGGLWFMTKAVLILLALELLLVPFMDFSTDSASSTELTASDGVALVLSILLIPVSLLCLSTLVVFYRNRAAVRG